MADGALSFEVVDVFADAAGGGNPLAVCFGAAHFRFSDAEYLRIAQHFGFSETVFVLPTTPVGDVGGCTHRLRIFTPEAELPFAGHPNVGAAAVLAWREPGAEAFMLEELAGAVPVGVVAPALSSLDLAGGITHNKATGAELIAPQPFSRGGEVFAATAAENLGVDEADVLRYIRIPAVDSLSNPGC